ncbi:MAG: transketolase [Synergistaceae bacterium]|jgi:transketolase|nr:transketolase [Synergistaceae bacterium]
MDAVVLTELEARALDVRRDIVRMLGIARTGHMASSLSAADILVWLYGAVLSVRPAEPLWEDRDRFVLSKAAASPTLYAVLADRGFFHRDALWGYRQLGSTLQAFADSRRTPGVDVSCGALGVGPGISLGLALAFKKRTPEPRVFCLIGTRELQEGSVWESLIVSVRHKLNNLIFIVDKNDGILDDGLEEKFHSFGWAAVSADGHDMNSLNGAFESLPSHCPRLLIAKTLRGKGIPSLERGTPAGGAGPRTTDDLLKELEGLDDVGTEEKPGRSL